MRALICAFLLTFAGLSSLHAQKFGYLNSNQLLASLPEVEEADKELEAYQSDLVAQGQKMVAKFETSYEVYMDEVDQGILSKVEMAEREKKLGEDQQNIQAYEQEVQQKIIQKRQELLSPILERIDAAIQEYGKENGYTFIFDSGAPGAILYAPDADDVIDGIKAKLGVQ